MIRAVAPLVPLYAAAVRAKNLAYERGWRVQSGCDGRS